MKLKNPLLLIIVVVILAAALLGWYVLRGNNPAQPDSNASLEQRQQEFVRLANAAQLRDKTPIAESSGPLCSGSSYSSGTDCTLSKSFTYVLDGNYRDNGKALFAHLKSKGFDFQKGDKYKSEVQEKLNNTRIADNLSNSEPIIVDLYSGEGLRVRVLLGDKERTMPYATNPAITKLPAGQLVAGLQFYNQ